VDGVRIAYHIENAENTAAPIVVLLHGSFCSRKIFMYPEPYQGNLRLLAITRPGFGESDDYPASMEKYGYELIVKIVAQILDSLPNSEKFHAIGYSAGGPCALACKAMLPERCVRCLILSGDSEYASNPEIDTAGLECCTPGRCCGPCGTSCLIPCYTRCMLCPASLAGKDAPRMGMTIEGLSTAERDDLERSLGAISSNRKESAAQDWLLHVDEAMYDSIRGGKRANGINLDVIGPSKPWPCKKALTDGTIKNPAEIEIFYGDKDSVVKPRCSEYTHELVPGSSLTRVEGMGHMGMIFPGFMAERVASLANAAESANLDRGGAPEQERMLSA